MASLIVGVEKEPAGGFALPEGFTVPEGTKEGGTFEALVTLKLGPGGMAMPTAVDGIPIQGKAPEASEEEETEDVAEDEPFADRVGKMIKPMNPDEAPGDADDGY